MSASPEWQIVSASPWCWGCAWAVFPCRGVCVSLLQQPRSAAMPVLPPLLRAARRALGVEVRAGDGHGRRQGLLYIQSLSVLAFLIKYYFFIYLRRAELRFAIQVVLKTSGLYRDQNLASAKVWLLLYKNTYRKGIHSNLFCLPIISVFLYIKSFITDIRFLGVNWSHFFVLYSAWILCSVSLLWCTRVVGNISKNVYGIWGDFIHNNEFYSLL